MVRRGIISVAGAMLILGFWSNPALACHSGGGPVRYHVDPPSAGPYSACVTVTTPGNPSAFVGVRADSNGYLYSEVWTGESLCSNPQFCVFAGAGYSLDDGGYAYVCYVDQLGQYICLPPPLEGPQPPPP